MGRRLLSAEAVRLEARPPACRAAPRPETDAATFGITAAILMLAAAAAIYVPARRASAVDPPQALCHE